MAHKGWNAAILFALFAVWFAGNTQREHPVVDEAHAGRVATLEDRLVRDPSSQNLSALTQAYLEANAPGMALAAIERAPAKLRSEPGIDHLYARALLEQGRSQDALVAERRVLERCADPALEPACSPYLVASATRRAGILAELVQIGVEDANAFPEASNLAYANATRRATFAMY